MNALAKKADFHFSVSMTTRLPRPSEVAAGKLVEWAEYGGNLYGTPRDPVIAHLEAGESVLLDIENDGAGQVKRSYPDAVLVFLVPPSLAELERRLRSRGDTNDAEVQRRLAVAESQIADAEANFDHLVVNKDIATAVTEVTGILSF